MTHNLQRFGIS